MSRARAPVAAPAPAEAGYVAFNVNGFEYRVLRDNPAWVEHQQSYGWVRTHSGTILAEARRVLAMTEQVQR